MVLKHLWSQTIQFSTKLFREKMSQLSNKTSVIDTTTLSGWYLYDQSLVWLSFQINHFSNSLPEHIKFKNQASTVFGASTQIEGHPQSKILIKLECTNGDTFEIFFYSSLAFWIYKEEINHMILGGNFIECLLPCWLLWSRNIIVFRRININGVNINIWLQALWR